MATLTGLILVFLASPVALVGGWMLFSFKVGALAFGTVCLSGALLLLLTYAYERIFYMHSETEAQTADREAYTALLEKYRSDSAQGGAASVNL